MEHPAFYVVYRNNWGYHENCLYTALKRACAIPDSALTASINELEGWLWDDDPNMDMAKKELDEFANEPDLLEDNEEKHVSIVVTDSNLWEFAESDPITGSPSYKWVGKGPKPPKVETLRIEAIVSLKGITIKN